MLRKAERFVRMFFLSSVLCVGSFQVVEDSLAQLEKCIQMASDDSEPLGVPVCDGGQLGMGPGQSKGNLSFLGPKLRMKRHHAGPNCVLTVGKEPNIAPHFCP